MVDGAGERHGALQEPVGEMADGRGVGHLRAAAAAMTPPRSSGNRKRARSEWDSVRAKVYPYRYGPKPRRAAGQYQASGVA